MTGFNTDDSLAPFRGAGNHASDHNAPAAENYRPRIHTAGAAAASGSATPAVKCTNFDG